MTQEARDGYRMKKTPLDRMMEKTVVEGECYIWTGYIDEDGYGRMLYNGKTQLVGRISYLIHHGEIQGRKKVTTNCGNRLCVRKEHIMLEETADEKKARQKLGSDADSGIGQVKITFGEYQSYVTLYGEPEWNEMKIFSSRYTDYYYTFHVDINVKIRGRVRVSKGRPHEYFRQ